MTKYKVTERKITDYKPDPQNPNKHRVRGASMVERSLEQYGAGRSLVADSNDIILAGNQTQQSASDLGIQDVVEIETDGNTLVVVKRRDMDLLKEPKKAREYSIADNRSSELGLEWDQEVLTALQMDSEINLYNFFDPTELNNLIDIPDFMPVDASDQPRLDEKTKVTCPNCGHEF